MSFIPSIVRDDRFLEHQPGEGHPESPKRLQVIHELIDSEFNDLTVLPPRLATENELALIHDPRYIQSVAATAGRSPSRLDPDTGVSPRSYEAGRVAVGGLLNGVDSLMNDAGPAGPVRSIFAFVRPPGHHAEHDRAMGFCLFNNVAVAAVYAREKHGLKRILVVDWDLHHGNGTQNSFYRDPSVLFFSSHQYPYYPGSGGMDQTGDGDGEGFTVNAPFPRGFGDAEYSAVYSRILKPIALEFNPELVLVSAGFDPYIHDPLGGMKVTASGFGALAGIVQDIAKHTCGKLLITLEGGYHPEGLRSGTRAVLNTLKNPPVSLENVPSRADEVIGKIAEVQKKYWKSI